MAYHIIMGVVGVLILTAVVGDFFGGRERHNRREARHSDPSPYIPMWMPVTVMLAVGAGAVAVSYFPLWAQVTLGLGIVFTVGWMIGRSRG
jgi:hypothetical protein